MYFPVFPLKKENFLNLMLTTWTIPSSRLYDFLLVIPFVSSKYYSVTKFVPFPTWNGSPNNNPRVILHTPTPYYFQSSDGLNQFGLTEQELTLCYFIHKHNLRIALLPPLSIKYLIQPLHVYKTY